MTEIAVQLLDIASLIAIGILVVSFLVVVARLALGPTFADRVMCLDLLVTLGIGFIAVIAIRMRQYVYIDVAIALGLVGFLATAAFARFMIYNERRSDDAEGEADAMHADQERIQ